MYYYIELLNYYIDYFSKALYKLTHLSCKKNHAGPYINLLHLLIHIMKYCHTYK